MWRSIGILNRLNRKKKLVDKYTITDDASEDSKWAARIFYYSNFQVDPDKLSDEDFIRIRLSLEFCLKERGEITYGK